MAIDNKSLEFLYANRFLFKNKKILMIGRQSNATTLSFSRKLALDIEGELYSEKIFECFGCECVESIDFSDYENPTYIHDMNLPIGSSFFESFDIIFDGGTTEHIFNAQIALQNYRLMLKRGGYYIGVLPSNNFCNHGFWQFSPDLFYRFFSKENGFHTKIFLYICNSWYFVKDLLDLLEPLHFNMNIGREAACSFVISRKDQCVEKYITPYQTIYNSLLRKNKPIKKSEEKSGVLLFFIIQLFKKTIPNSLQLFLYNKMNSYKLLKKIKTPNF